MLGDRVMSDTFLEEQVRRIQQLAERMTQATRNRVNPDSEAPDRQADYGPLQSVRDVRVVNSVPTRDRATDHSPRRRRRRR